MKKSERHSLSINKRVQNHFRLFLDTLDEHNEIDLHDIYNELWEANPTDILEIRINSSGGYLKTGHTLCNIITDKFPDSCMTIIDSSAHSMASTIFLHGTERIVYPHSSLLIHDYKSGYIGKISDIEDKMKAEKKILRKGARLLLKDFLTKKEWKKYMNGRDIWFDARQMCERDIATKIIIGANAVESQTYVEETK